jgi:hypothetical protein
MIETEKLVAAIFATGICAGKLVGREKSADVIADRRVR